MYSDIFWHLAASTDPTSTPPTISPGTTMTVGTSTTTSLTDNISPAIQNWTYLNMWLYGLSMISSLWTAVHICINYRPRADRDILLIDSWVTTFSQIGILITLGSSISDKPSGYLCTLAEFGAVVSYGCPIFSFLSMSYVG